MFGQCSLGASWKCHSQVIHRLENGTVRVVSSSDPRSRCCLGTRRRGPGKLLVPVRSQARGVPARKLVLDEHTMLPKMQILIPQTEDY